MSMLKIILPFWCASSSLLLTLMVCSSVNHVYSMRVQELLYLITHSKRREKQHMVILLKWWALALKCDSTISRSNLWEPRKPGDPRRSLLRLPKSQLLRQMVAQPLTCRYPRARMNLSSTAAVDSPQILIPTQPSENPHQRKLRAVLKRDHLQSVWSASPLSRLLWRQRFQLS